MTELEGIHHHLTGLGHASLKKLAAIANLDEWEKLAQRELERRCSVILRGLTCEELEAVANGTIQLDREAKHVLQTLKEVATA